MLPNDNVSMSVGHLDHVLIVYSSMEHVTWKSPDPMCGWVGRILHPDSCKSVSFWSKVPFYPSGLSLCLSVDHFCLVPVDDMVLFHGMVCDGHWWTVLLVTVSIVINSSYWGCVLFVKLAVHLLVAFVLFSLLFVVAIIWRIKIYN